jgi:putative transcriptional regulator
MEIVVRLDVMLALRKMKSRDLADRIGITEQNVSLLRTGKVKGIRFETLARICEVLECQPGDILEAVESGQKKALDTVAQTP